MNIGKIIKERRIKLNLSADYVADKIGKSRATLYRYENGDIEKMPIPILEPLAKVLRTTPAELMGFTDDIELNHTEKKLLNDFRSLNEQGQEYVLQTVDIVKDKYSSELKKSSQEEYIQVAARGNSELEIVSDDDAVRKDLENYKPPTDL